MYWCFHFNIVIYVIYFFGLSEEDDLYSQDRFSGISTHSKCEPIEVQFCQGLEYNQTMMPNSKGHQDQKEAALAVHVYYPVLKMKCNPDIQLFLCSYYVPICTDLGPLLPCRSLCLSIKNDCKKFIEQFDFKSPDLECSKFPDERENALCIRRNQTNTPMVNYDVDDASDIVYGSNLSKNSSYITGVSKEFPFTCPAIYKVDKGNDYFVRVDNAIAKNCALPCHGVFFSAEQINTSQKWIAIWSIICALSCLFTVLTFSLNTSRFRYPERPIIFLAICYLIISSTYLVGYMFGNKLVCQEAMELNKYKSGHLLKLNESLIVQGTKNELCTITFMASYFFSMASALWWVILTLTWFLAAGLKWGHEAIEANSQYFHFIAWAIPTIKTITILAMGTIEGDVLTGICYVGVWNMNMMHRFILEPLSIYLFVGIIFLLFGFISLFKIRKSMKNDRTKLNKLEKLMLRIGVFSILYTVPAVAVILCLQYEQNHFDEFMVSWHRKICNLSTSLIRCPTAGPIVEPNFRIHMLKYLSSLVLGITSSVWIWSRKTVASWKELISKSRWKNDQVYL